MCEDNDEVEESEDFEQEDRCSRTMCESNSYLDNQPMTRRVKNMASPILDVLYNGDRMNITVDSGSTSNMIREDVVRRHGITIFPCGQKAGQADGVSKLDTIGEVHFTVLRDGKPMLFDGLVVKTLGDDIGNVDSRVKANMAHI